MENKLNFWFWLFWCKKYFLKIFQWSIWNYWVNYCFVFGIILLHLTHLALKFLISIFIRSWWWLMCFLLNYAIQHPGHHGHESRVKFLWAASRSFKKWILNHFSLWLNKVFSSRYIFPLNNSGESVTLQKSLLTSPLYILVRQYYWVIVVIMEL